MEPKDLMATVSVVMLHSLIGCLILSNAELQVLLLFKLPPIHSSFLQKMTIESVNKRLN
ncbi:putative lipoprotein [Providencia alcalifaciens F90-2004]|uniref:Uncharacterized protein n=1 Tax=Providencia alcalifaciens DSM 30120 TaxID=520999 RepID=B6XFH6_9GAMM|nr:hypothetical protein PROVALCAL_02107 [Providencia alcalifaciens DSM 30120]ETT04248.1 putative lipoprotein [Providencia alcalifaciens F90-2004]